MRYSISLSRKWNVAHFLVGRETNTRIELSCSQNALKLVDCSVWSTLKISKIISKCSYEQGEGWFLRDFWTCAANVTYPLRPQYTKRESLNGKLVTDCSSQRVMQSHQPHNYCHYFINKICMKNRTIKKKFCKNFFLI